LKICFYGPVHKCEHQPFQVKKQNLSEVLKKNIELKKQIADQKEISLSGRFPENLEAFFDREMINTVIRNILSNAIKFTPQGRKCKTLYYF
jgi:signal transduction histidine kinase